MTIERQHLTFISYSRADKEFALELARELRSSGFLIWLDQLDIPTGARWDDEVEKALEQCAIFMVILTPESIASNNVKDEIGYAIDSNKRILPVLLENAKVPLRLRRFQYVDFTRKSHEEGIESAKQLLRSLLGEAKEPGAVAPSMNQEEVAERIAPEKVSKEAVESAGRRQAEPEVAEKTVTLPERKSAPRPVLQRKPILTCTIIGIMGLCIIGAVAWGVSYLASLTASPPPQDQTEISTPAEYYATNTLMPTEFRPTEITTPEPARAFASIRLRSGDTIQFSTGAIGPCCSGGDLYYLDDVNYAPNPSFFANNIGQEGIMDLGNIGGIPLDQVTPPTSGYEFSDVEAILGHTYVSLANANEAGHYIIFRIVDFRSGEYIELEFYYL